MNTVKITNSGTSGKLQMFNMGGIGRFFESLGKEYALLFASRGAAVVVNDLGGSFKGEGSDKRAADLVVDEIIKAGGKAVANYDSVEDGEKIIKTAIDHFGRVDILVNNAGILRDRSFLKTEELDWDLVQKVHVKGAYKTTRAAWEYMRKQNYGRIIMTSSGSGIYGNFGQANYSAAKLALVGLSNTLAQEGKSKNIHCNTIVPIAGSRMTQGILPPDLMDNARPDLVAPVVAWLCHESCPENGAIIEAAAGWVGRYRWERTRGVTLRKRTDEGLSPEKVRDSWEEISDFRGSLHPESNQEAAGLIGEIVQNLIENTTSSTPKSINYDDPVATALNWDPEGVQYEYTTKDVILYALAIGASIEDSNALDVLYEGGENFAPLPTFGILAAQETLSSSGALTGSLPGIEFDLSKVLHGEQYLEVLKPLRGEAILTSKLKITDLVDKKSGALIVCDVETRDESDELVMRNQFNIFVVGAGNFGGKRQSDKIVPTVEPPKRKPDAVVEYKTFSNQISARSILKRYANSDPRKFKAMKARFAGPVVPGQTLVTEMWRDGNRVHFATKVAETGKYALTGGYLDLHNIEELVPAPSSINLMSDIVFAEMQKRIGDNPQLATKANAVLQWNILKNGKVAKHWTLDMKSKPAAIYPNLPKNGLKPGATLSTDDEVTIEIATGKLNPQKAFMQGKLKVQGNIMLTQKLQSLLKAETAKL
ncbi:peroxisomal multifunctional enzyme type 2-like [Artemia franciscana]|uniref:peroxisomal multifunctional enzyme type 2-like n=1 Tax=Artemia franciscana TaxID=6661 RepID=UPI0032DBC564